MYKKYRDSCLVIWITLQCYVTSILWSNSCICIMEICRCIQTLEKQKLLTNHQHLNHLLLLLWSKLIYGQFLYRLLWIIICMFIFFCLMMFVFSPDFTFPLFHIQCGYLFWPLNVLSIKQSVFRVFGTLK